MLSLQGAPKDDVRRGFHRCWIEGLIFTEGEDKPLKHKVPVLSYMALMARGGHHVYSFHRTIAIVNTVDLTEGNYHLMNP